MSNRASGSLAKTGRARLLHVQSDTGRLQTLPANGHNDFTAMVGRLDQREQLATEQFAVIGLVWIDLLRRDDRIWSRKRETFQGLPEAQACHSVA